ncbi:hypothetical protein [Streptomyces sp. NPDC002205]
MASTAARTGHVDEDFTIIHRVRQAEARHAVAADDATIAYCTDLGEA